MDHYIGKKLEGRYEIRELVGVGGMANVYKAHDVLEDRTVAVKILREEFAENEEFLKRFKIESKAISVLAHPNIVRVYDVTFTDRIQSIVMEYVDGITLKEYIEQQRVLKWKEAVHFTAQILRALQHAHDKGIIHRDIKPQNVMLQADGTIKVMDFGIARFNHAEPITSTDKVIGSVHYISPEQARGEMTDEKTDVYSVGVMLFEMLTGSLPFEASDPVSVAMKQISDKPTMPRELNPAIPEGLEDITLRAMQKNVSLRYQTAAEMLRDLEAFKQNPHIQFEYKYLINESPTKFMDAINKSKQNAVLAEEKADVAVAEKKKAPVLLILAGVACVLLVGVLILAYFFLQGLGGTEIPVPDLVGKELAAVKVDPNLADITFVENTAYSSEYPAGTIMEQDPVATGSNSMKSTGTMKITVSKGPKEVEIPNIYLMSIDTALKLLEARGFTNYAIEANPENDPEINDDYVTDTQPAIGETMAVDQLLIVYVNPPAKMLDVQNCVGMTYEEAKIFLEEAGFKVEYEYKASSEKKDKVLAQSAITAKKYSTITLTLSSGEEESVNVTVSVPMPQEATGSHTFHAYVDGVMMEGGTLTCYPSDRANWNVSLTGKTGSVTLVIRIETEDGLFAYANFTVDFDKETYTENWVKEFPPEETSHPEEESSAPNENPSLPEEDSSLPEEESSLPVGEEESEFVSEAA